MTCKIESLVTACAAIALLSGAQTFAVQNGHAQNSYDVAAIVWPAYQPEERWKELGIFNHGCGEWQNVYEAVSKKEGHKQPIVPYWGYENEANPRVVSRKIDAALAAGVNVFIYDWYWYGGRPFLENALNEGFLKAPNNERMKFFLMWANHDVDNLWNNKIGGAKKAKINWSADVSYEEFANTLVPKFINYFKKPNYYKINNKPVLAIFELKNFVRGMKSPESAKKAIEFLTNECKKAGFDGIYFMSMAWHGTPVAPLPDNSKPTTAEIAKYYSFDAMTIYNWRGVRDQGYKKWGESAIEKWEEYRKHFGTFYPIISTGWDNNPRFPKDEFTPTIERSVKDYENFLRIAKNWADKNIPKGLPKLIIINAWNEWTEGEHLEPDEQNGYDFLNATARVFGAHGQSD